MANRRSFAAHASAALDCQWATIGGAESAELVLSAGGYDLTVLQWRRVREPPKASNLSSPVSQAASPTDVIGDNATSAREKRRLKRLAREQSQAQS